ncbi:MAG: hypothetical protein LBC76_03905 [Treponema sp.]|jgi:hypothetical protein|nr:hypothetical protein [Treponema sp.]
MKYGKEEKIMWLEDWQQSGKSAWVYAKENGLVPWTLPQSVYKVKQHYLNNIH